MKTTLLYLFACLSTWVGAAQVTFGHVDDFQDGTIQGWIIGNGNPSGIGTSVVIDGGPGGVGDNALDYSSTGAGGASSRMVIFNQSSNWQGNYLNQGIEVIKFDVKAEINDLNLKIAFQRGTNSNFTRIATINPVLVEAGSGWTRIEMPMQLNNFEIVDNFQGNYSISEVLEDVSVMRILSSTNSLWLGEQITANIQLDNITATTTLSNAVATLQNDIQISQNPASEMMTVTMAEKFTNASIIVYDLLGKKVHESKLLSNSSQLNISKWNVGVYLLRVTSDGQTMIKRFVKQ